MPYPAIPPLERALLTEAAVQSLKNQAIWPSWFNEFQKLRQVRCKIPPKQGQFAPPPTGLPASRLTKPNGGCFINSHAQTGRHQQNADHHGP
jgi:hypothetical protein